MRVLIQRGFCLEAGRDVQPGDVVDVEERRAALLIRQGKAQAAPEPAPPPAEQIKERKKNAPRSIQ